ncbi:siderophore-interacting protein [Dyadobacter crusticola]|uniref:siderophore-interacting protein n=1 Tax=Dyadobacter crusticola TaxID=292407 RepID=UPI0004E1A95C|nr:siderophore-interacting protein [Dyadobacter crusticola]
MTNLLKRAAAGLLESMLTAGTVTDVRTWQPGYLFEVDLHLPTVDMKSWDSIKRLKCKVDALQYRDYTPALWNSELNLTTLFIDAAHQGAGSRWVRQLQTGDKVLFGAAHAAVLPAHKGRMLCIGDASAIGHFLALKQLTDQAEHPMETGILIGDDYEIPDDFKENNPEFRFIRGSAEVGIPRVEQWLRSKDLSVYKSIYIAGNIPMMKALRRTIKADPTMRARIYGHGFWS